MVRRTSKPQQTPSPCSGFRLGFVALVLMLVLMAIGYRIIQLTVLDRAFLLSQGNARSLRDIPVPSHRGMLLDRNKNVLAVSTPVMSVWISPKDFNVEQQSLRQIAKALGLSEVRLRKKIIANQSRQFLYLKREVTPYLAQKIKAMAIPGINLTKEFKRYYPLSNIFASILGFTNIDDKGIEGLELAFEPYLKGEVGVMRVIKNRLGQVIDEIALIKPQRKGQSISLSLDKRLQFIAYHYLKETVKEYAAHSGSVVVLKAQTGEVLAMANYPSFNPNLRIFRRDHRHRNQAVTDLFEPGSVMKAFSVASALDSGLFTPNSLIDTSPSYLNLDGNIIRDDHPVGVVTVTEVLKRSSNVGVTKMVLSSPAHQLEDLLRRVGFGQLTDSGFPGESAGVLQDKSQSSPFVLATLGFGYGLSVTPLQLAQAYSVFANAGYLMPATFIASEQAQQKAKQVINGNIAQAVLNMLEAVVEKGGTGRLAQVKGYRVAGKTGTSRVATANGYDKNKHIASFVGIAPVSKPQLVIAVVIREPTQKSYYGGRVAAPLFAKVMQQSLQIMGISPDKLQPENRK